ncbi:DsbA family protein [Xanthomonas sp. A2111]|uniref:2-hydroxychromene-2-carboxylate isomerase n=1 Tax=Xanthomonas hawaiiensis TaxID=3003247 RepID=A0ABU2I284_9XANT|nr:MULTISPECIES: DsbA family protein [unclassified Xanthomonas]MBO9828547.1 DsbA family protein [Xanthomonas sp. A2111]MBO9873723.1 DsbA family protein [Xanthomonas sp. D-93]MDS9992260.1 DsbA family protein [Xanthomonas sp. A2111]WNH44054.1 DsbA family protein [Xanthomonas sp. A6251]
MTLRWYFDFISPFSYLHWQQVKTLPEFDRIQPVPIVFGAVLAHLQARGPAEVPHKREFTYRFVQWQAQQQGVPLRFPPAHPFNPLTALRLCVAAGTTAQAIDALFDWLWRDGHAGDDAAALAPVGQALGIADVAAATADAQVKAQLRANTEQALAAGVFGVPTLQIDDTLLWGNDAHALMRAVLADPQLLQRGEMARLATLPAAVQRGA